MTEQKPPTKAAAKRVNPTSSTRATAADVKKKAASRKGAEVVSIRRKQRAVPTGTRGAPPTCTPETTARICNTLRAGNTLAVAAAMADVGRSTLASWMQRGRSARLLAVSEKVPERELIYLGLLESVERAMAEAEAYAVLVVRNGMQDDPKWAAWFLQHARQDTWGARQQLVVGGMPDQPLQVQAEVTVEARLRQDAEVLEVLLQTGAIGQLPAGDDPGELEP